MQQKSNHDSSTLRPILAIDFEPIIYPGDPYEAQRFNAWPLEKPPQDGAFQFLEAAQHYFEVHVVSWRSSHWEYLRWWKRFHWPTEGKTGRPEYLKIMTHPESGTFLYMAARTREWKGGFPSPLELTKFSPYALGGSTIEGT